MLKLANARYVVRDGYPLLLVEVDGREATMASETKPTLHGAGLVFVGSEFADVLPDVTIHPPDGGTTTLRGFSDDRRLFKLFDAFLIACNDGTFRPGPVPIPSV